MLNLPNLLSFSRLPLALFFFVDNFILRASLIVVALLTDYLDGFIARKTGLVSRFGAVLDPITDRVFVLVATSVLLVEERLTWWALAAFFTRDLLLFFFWAYLSAKRSWESYRCGATLWGKVTTVSQLFLLLALSLNLILPAFFYLIVMTFGLLTFIELFLRYEKGQNKISEKT